MNKHGQVREAVSEAYARAIRTPSEGGACCAPPQKGVVVKVAGYTREELDALPPEAVINSFGCGNPLAFAGVQPGQVVLDIGSGAGIDCLIAAEKVGPTGRVIGLDMTPEMIERGRGNAREAGALNVEFRLGEAEKMPVEDASVDWLISNCVINLSPDKPAVFQEAYRVLRPGGRIAVSDMVTQGRFSPQERADMAAWSGCITGAEDVADYVAAIQAAGFANISVQDKDAPDIELANSLGLYIGQPRLFSARVTAEKPA